MKLIFNKVTFAGSHIAVFPRVEFSPTDTIAMAQATVDLGRKPSGKCVYPLGGLQMHDFHAPDWALDGSASQESSAPEMNIQLYMERIVAEVKSKLPGVEFEVEVKEDTVHPPKAEPGEGSGPALPPGPDAVVDNWDKYTHDPGKADHEEKADDETPDKGDTSLGPN